MEIEKEFRMLESIDFIALAVFAAVIFSLDATSRRG